MGVFLISATDKNIINLSWIEVAYRFNIQTFPPVLRCGLVGPIWAQGKGNGGGTTAVLTDAEADHLLFLREEEKLARDVYIALAGQYGTSIFVNISASEQTHMNSVKGLIDTYDLIDPVLDDAPGVFSNTVIEGIYSELMTKGVLSLKDALEVGVMIEEMDIHDQPYRTFAWLCWQKDWLRGG